MALWMMCVSILLLIKDLISFLFYSQAVLNLSKDKNKVIVIGGGKSSVDVAERYALKGKDVTIVMRQVGQSSHIYSHSSLS